MEDNWNIDIQDPIKGRADKPRLRGLTMVLDKGLGPGELNDLIKVGNKYIDFVKFSFGTSFVFPSPVLQEKIDNLKESGIDVYPGGTLFEVAASQKKINEFLLWTRQLGFSAIEISDGTIKLEQDIRSEVIDKANTLGFKVLTEVGKKDRKLSLTLTEMIDQIKNDIASGAFKVIIEGRESGKGISIYKSDGSIDRKMFEGIKHSIKNHEEYLIWEAPLKKQQATLINELGPNVNLGNINVREVIALETLRRGLRGDTFKYTITKEENQGIVGV